MINYFNIWTALPNLMEIASLLESVHFHFATFAHVCSNDLNGKVPGSHKSAALPMMAMFWGKFCHVVNYLLISALEMCRLGVLL